MLVKPRMTRRGADNGGTGFRAAGADTKGVALRWSMLPPLPDPEGFAAPFTGVAGGTLIVAGGANFPDRRPWEGGIKQWYDRVYGLDQPDGAWRELGRLPHSNAYGVSATVPDGVVCVGGGDASRHFTDAFVLQWNGHALTRRALPPLPIPCAFMSGAMAGSVLYLAGGISEPKATEALGKFWSMDLASPSSAWRELPSWPGSPRMLAVAGAIGEEFYLVSGVALHPDARGLAMRTYLSDAFVYHPARGWSRLPDLPNPVVAAPSPSPVTPDGGLLVLGGDDGRSVHLNGPHHPGFPRKLLRYDSGSATWQTIGELPFSHATVPTTQWRGRWIIPNGERIPAYRTPEVWSLECGSPAGAFSP
jgi:N-acetylneuraminic acid mutarotase